MSPTHDSPRRDFAKQRRLEGAVDRLWQWARASVFLIALAMVPVGIYFTILYQPIGYFGLVLNLALVYYILKD
jgi:hypothetical protein